MLQLLVRALHDFPCCRDVSLAESLLQIPEIREESLKLPAWRKEAPSSRASSEQDEEKVLLLSASGAPLQSARKRLIFSLREGCVV